MNSISWFLIVARESDYTEKELKEVQTMLKSAARDCIPQERNAFVAFQANTGVEVWLFTLIFLMIKALSKTSLNNLNASIIINRFAHSV